MTASERMASLPKSGRRAVALLVLAALGVILWVGFEALGRIASSQDRWRSTVAQQIAGHRGRAAHEADVRRALADLPSGSIWKRHYPANSTVELSRLIEQDVARLSTTLGIVFDTALPLAAVETIHWTSAGVRLTTSMTAEQLRALLTTVRSHEPYLRLERLTVTAPQSQSADANPTLTVTLDLLGYTRQGSSSA